jgi:hypothetical protein
MAGLLLLGAGILWYFFSDKIQWLGKLPGDFRYEGENSKFYFPITTMLLISAVINLILWLIRKFF